MRGRYAEGFWIGHTLMPQGLRLFALASAFTLITAPAFAAKAPATPEKATKVSQAAVERDKALMAFQRDLISVLAPRADAMPLLAAAVLARPLANQPEVNSFHALIGRAFDADRNSAPINWARLADCDAKAGNCPDSTSLERLQEHDADNAAVWMLKLGADVHEGKADEAREDLSRAAAAKVYDDYTGITLKALASSVGVLPPPADTLDPEQAGGAAGMQAVMVYGLAAIQPQPAMQVIATYCEESKDDASIKADCLKLGKTLEWGSSPLARSLGLHLREMLSDDSTQQDDARRARLDLIWQVQNFAHLASRAPGDKTVAQHMLALARRGGTEMSLMLAALRDNGIPHEAPADWTPKTAN